MASLQTKQKIIDAAVGCFNREGIANVRLQHIADEAVVSVGNMTYHYRNKEAVVEAVWQQLVQKQRDLLAEFRILPLFEDVERLLYSTFELQQQYRFFYLDTLEVMRAHPHIQTAHRQHIQWQVGQMVMAIHFNVSRGAFFAEKWEGQFSQLAQQFWMIADHWMYRQQVQQETTGGYNQFRMALWMLLRPLFTDMGEREFEQLHGEH
jgi:AcrR family transcriptional regulator